MKKFHIILFLLIFQISWCVAETSFVIDDIRYEISSTEDKTLTVLPRFGMDRISPNNCYEFFSVVIPEHIFIDGIEYTVTRIGDYAFCYCFRLSYISIPSSINSIGQGAFEYCYNLSSIEIKENVSFIGDDAFNGCTGLNSIIVDSNNGRFYSSGNCLVEKATGVLIKGCNNSSFPKGVTVVGRGAFSGCIDLSSIILSDGVKSIEANAFYGCSSIETIVIPESVTNIGNNAFFDCKNLLSVTFSDNLISVGLGAFDNTLWFDNHKDGLLYIGKVAYKYKGIMFDDTTITIRDNVVSIGDYCFQNCVGLDSVIIPEGLVSIGKGAFHGCENLSYIDIPQSVTRIGESAFCGCRNLLSVSIPEDVDAIGESTFMNCISLKSVKLSDHLVQVGKLAFSGCSALPTIIIPKHVNSIGFSAFENCSSLISIELPESLISIEDNTFNGCSNLVSIHIPDSVIYIGKFAFYGCSSLTNLVIPSNVTCIGGYAYNNCFSLKTITFYSMPKVDGIIDCYNIILQVPLELVDDFKNDVKWGKYSVIVPMGTIERNITIPISGYTTFYDSQYAYKLPPELKAIVVTGISHGNLIYKTIVDGATAGIIPPGVAVLLFSNTPGETSMLQITTEESYYFGSNLLMGTDEDMFTYSDYISFYYKLSNASYAPDDINTIGWYWGADGGDCFMIEAHKAWLSIPVSQANDISVFLIQGDVTSNKEKKKDNQLEMEYELNGKLRIINAGSGIFLNGGRKELILE